MILPGSALFSPEEIKGGKWLVTGNAFSDGLSGASTCSLVSRRYREKTEETKAVQNLLLRRLIQNVTRKKAKKKKKESFRFWT